MGSVGDPWDPISRLDLCILVEASVLLFIVCFCYALEPHWDPRRPGRLSFLSFASCAWVYPQIRGPRDPAVTADDFPDSCGTASYNVEKFVERFEARWSPQSEASLLRAVIWLMLPAWRSVHVVKGLDRMMQFVDAYLLACIVAFVEGSHGWAVGLKLTAVAILQRTISDVAHHNSWWPMNDGRCKVSVPLQVMVLRKLRRLGPQGLAATSTADVQQLMYDIGDQLEVGLGLPGPKFVFVDLLRCVIVVWQLSKFYGVAAFTTGLATALLLLYGQSFCVVAAQEAADAARGSSKRRLALLHEMTETLLPLKLYGWTRRYLAPLARAAATLAKGAREQAVWNALGTLLGGAVGDVFCVVALFVSVFALEGRPDVQTFVMAQVFTSILQTSIDDIRAAYRGVKLLQRVIARVERFLRLPEYTSGPSNGMLAVAGCSFEWATIQDGQAVQQQVLSKVELRATPGELVVVSGPVGAGKSSLLLSLLGETSCSNGSLCLPEGPIAYQPQLPCLLEGSIRQNILFGLGEHDADEKYMEVALTASQLAVDMDCKTSTLHALREFTQVGKRGGELSGGQRARTLLARAVYAALLGAKLILLDDPVAAVDNELVDAAWKAAVLTAMQASTRIIVVNAQLLERLGPDADRVVLLEGGRVVFNGRPGELKAQSGLLERLGGGYDIGSARSGSPTGEQLKPSSAMGTFDTSYDLQVARLRGPGRRDSKPVVRSSCSADYGPRSFALFLRRCESLQGFLERPLPLKRNGAAPRAEQLSVSPVHLSTVEWAEFRNYLGELERRHPPRSMSSHSCTQHKSDLAVCLMFFRRQWLWVLGGVICTFLAEVAQPAAIEVLQLWAGGASGLGNLVAFAIFMFLALGGMVFGSLSQLLQGWGVARCSVSIRGEIDERLVQLSMPYFWCGGKVEDVLAVVSIDPIDFGTISILVGIVAQNVVGVAAVLYSMPTLLPLVALASILFRHTNFPKSWAFKQLLPISQGRSAVLMHKAAEEFDSRVAVKAMRRQWHFDKVVQRAAMKGLYVERTFIAARNLASMFNMVVDCVFAASALAVVVRTKTMGGDAAQAVVLYKLVLGLSSKIQLLQRTYDTAAETVGKYRRVEDFISTEHTESPVGRDAPASWPSRGAISFCDVSFRYAPHTPLALQGFSAEIRGGEKVGVVGPTGSGKSTLLNLLFRLGPLQGVAPFSAGTVLIDGVDVASLRLSALRAALGVVPQEPVIFHGSLRSNLGGSDVAESAALAALHSCGLHKLAVASSLERELAASDLSLGEMQLLATARALVRRPRILVLDEATAMLDQDSAERLLSVISRQTADATVLSIAHRLSFVLQCDRILVLRRGGTLEAFAPREVLQQDPDGYFTRQLRAEQRDEWSLGGASDSSLSVDGGVVGTPVASGSL